VHFWAIAQQVASIFYEHFPTADRFNLQEKESSSTAWWKPETIFIFYTYLIFDSWNHKIKKLVQSVSQLKEVEKH